MPRKKYTHEEIVAKLPHVDVAPFLESNWARVLALAVVTFSSWIAIYYARQPLVDLDTFRQTETALTAYWMIQEGWQLAYQTPGWGYPWAAPIEFPIYQAIVALIAGATYLPLEPVGRLVSFSFLIACAWPAFQVSQRLKLPPEAAWVFCALLWSSPLYLAWGRTFMIETAAVFFTLAAIPYLLDLRTTQRSWRSVILGSGWATLGMLQKSITTGPTLVVLAILLVAPSLRNWHGNMRLRKLGLFMLAFGVPLGIGLLWTIYSDIIKNYNFVGRELTLNFRFSAQYLGTIHQRVNPEILKEIFWTRIIDQNAAGFIGVALIFGALWLGQPFVRRLILVCLVLAALPIFIFLNVSLLLKYYQVSSVVFVHAALALCCVAWLPTVRHGRATMPFVVVTLIVANIFNFWSGYGRKIRAGPDVWRTRSLLIGDVIKKYTPQDSGIIVFGLYAGLSSISPEIPYFSERKGFTVPDWAEDRVGDDPALYLGGKKLGAMVFCSSRNKERSNEIIARYSDSSAPRLFRIQGCYVWLPHTQVVSLTDGTMIAPTKFIDPLDP